MRIGRQRSLVVASGRRLPELSRELGISGLEQTDEGAVVERRADGLDFGELAAAPEDFEKARRLSPAPAEYPPLVQDDSPGPDGIQREDEQYGFGNRAGVPEDFEKRRS
jgi:hypothetical protein